jgi:hypothetical protein
MALSAGRAACACNATVVMIDLDNECPGPDVARALGRTPARRRRARPHTPSPGPSPSWPSRTKTNVGSAGGQRHCLRRRTPIPADRAGSAAARAGPPGRLQDEKTDEAAAALRLAWALELVVDENLDEPLELGWPQADAVIRALPEFEAHAYSGLEVLLQAAWRLADAAP